MPAQAANHVTVMRSEGQRMFLAVTGTLTAIAAELGAKPNMVSYWRSGEKLPSHAARARIQEAFGIPRQAWALLPGATLNAAEPPPDAPEPASPTTYQDCCRLLAVIRRDRSQPNLMLSERTRLASVEAHVLRLKKELEEAAELAEARYVMGHPAWLRLRRQLVAALEPYPQAAQAVLDVIVKNELGS